MNVQLSRKLGTDGLVTRNIIDRMRPNELMRQLSGRLGVFACVLLLMIKPWDMARQIKMGRKNKSNFG